MASIENDKSLRGGIAFSVHDPKNPCASTEVLRFEPDGSCYVRGEKVEENSEVWRAFRDWLAIAKRDV